tara:strand:+ start:427 stop:714 length:288 start_codon:yes stop_codon:yes gene_type:complete
MSYQQAHFECYKHNWKSSLVGCIHCINSEQSAEIARLQKQAASDTQRFKEMEQHGLELEAELARLRELVVELWADDIDELAKALEPVKEEGEVHE